MALLTTRKIDPKKTAANINEQRLAKKQQQLRQQNAQIQPVSSPVVKTPAPPKKPPMRVIPTSAAPRPASVQPSQPNNLATLINPATGEKRVVRSGSPAAKPFFNAGFVLMGSQEEKDRRAQIQQKPQQPAQTNIPEPAPTPAPAPQTLTQPAPTQPQQPSELDLLRQAVLANIQPSEAERSTAAELGELLTGTAENIAGLEGQGRGITLATVRGQQGALARQAEAEKQTLESRLGRAQAERQAALEAAKTLLGFEEEDAARNLAEQQARQQQVQALALTAAQRGASAEQVDNILSSPDFQTAITQAREFLTAPEQAQFDPITVKPGETIVDPATGEIIYSAPQTGGDIDTMSPLDQLKFTKLQQEITGQTPEAQEELRSLALQSQNVMQKVDELLENEDGLSRSIGLRFPFNTLTSPSARKFMADLNQLQASLVLPEAQKLKGALSDKDIAFLQNAASTLGERGVSENVYKQTLQEVKERAKHVVNKAKLPPEFQTSYDDLRLRAPEATPDEIFQEIQERTQNLTFNTVGADTNQGSVVQKLSQAIAIQESGGNYNAIGPATAKGNRAYGKYQVMDFNIPNWTQQAIGTPLTPQQFLQNPQVQDAVAQFKMSELLDKYGNVADVASAWFSGRPLKQAGNASDVTGTTVPRYVQNVLANFSKIA